MTNISIPVPAVTVTPPPVTPPAVTVTAPGVTPAETVTVPPVTVPALTVTPPALSIPDTQLLSQMPDADVIAYLQGKGYTVAAAKYIYRQGATLHLPNGSPLTFCGANNFSIVGADAAGTGVYGSPVSNADVVAYFSALKPWSVTRVWAFQQGGLAVVENVVSIAQQYNQLVILNFADGSGYYPPPNTTLDASWYTSGFANTAGSYWQWVNTLTTTPALVNSPAILCWEIMNEATSNLNQWPSPLTLSQMQNFYNTMAAFIKSNDPNHLVSTGCNIQSFNDSAANQAALHSGPNIDIVSSHQYDYANSDSAGTDLTVAAGQQLNKPVIIGEYGVGSSLGTTAAQRATFVNQILAQYVGHGVAGMLYWTICQYSWVTAGNSTTATFSYDPVASSPVFNAICAF